MNVITNRRKKRGKPRKGGLNESPNKSTISRKETPMQKNQDAERCEKLRKDIESVVRAIERPEILERLHWLTFCILFAEPDEVTR